MAGYGKSQEAKAAFIRFLMLMTTSDTMVPISPDGMLVEEIILGTRIQLLLRWKKRQAIAFYGK